MISNRHYKQSVSEDLQQFPLSFSKGIDNTAKLKDNATVYDMKNLSVNPDGTLSLRKRLEYEFSFVLPAPHTSVKFYKVFQLYNGDFFCTTISGSWFIKNSDDGSWTYHNDTTSVNYCTNTGRVLPNYPYTGIDTDACTFFNVTDATVLGNCAISAAIAGIDVTLYPTNTTSVWRFVKLYKKSGTWYFEIQDPESNTLSTADNGDLAFNANFALDNPYSLCDTYNVSAPTVKGILAYQYNGTVGTTTNSYKPFVNDAANVVYVDTMLSFDYTAPTDTASNNDPIYRSTESRLGASEFDIFMEATLLDYESDPPPTVPVTQYDVCLIDRVNYPTPTDDPVKLNTRSVVDLEITLGIIENDVFQPYYPAISVFYSQLEPPSLGNIGVIQTNTQTNNIGTYPRFSRAKVTGKVYSVYNPAETCVHSTLQPSVQAFCESVNNTYKIVESSSVTNKPFFLKAFCNFPVDYTNCYVTWLKTTDGAYWTNVLPEENTTPVYTEDGLVESYIPLYTPADSTDTMSHLNLVNTASIDDWGSSSSIRPDVLEVLNTTGVQYMFKMVSIKTYIENGITKNRIVTEFGRSIYTFMYSDTPKYLTNDIANAACGKKLYHNTKIYSYGAQANHILVSEPGEFISPLANIIDLAANADQTVTAVIPWNNYIVAATDTALYLITPASVGYTTKTLNAAIGISKFDANCCKAILNSVIFKSGPKVYMLYPNLYSGTDTIMNVAEVSTPVQELMLELNADASWCTAVSTDSEYWLFWAYDDQCVTKCLVYNYVTKVWQHYTYPIRVVDVLMKDINTIQLYGQWVGTLDGDVDALSLYTIHLNTMQQPDDIFAQDVVYLGDLISDGHGGYIQHVKRTPISFEIDTGQKTDTVATTKQFVETKVVASTMQVQNDKFPMALTIAVNGEPRIITRDLTTDAGFRYEHPESDGHVLGANSKTGLADIKKVPKQMVCRYSGKGTSIRHILSGESVYDFRIHEMYVRYKYPKTKQ